MSLWKRIFGWTLIFVGVPGLFLPVLQGLLTLSAGLLLLSTEYEWARKLRQKIMKKR